MKKVNWGDFLQEAIVITFATVIVAASVFFFLVPSSASVSSISGLGIVVSQLVPITVGQFTLLMNVILLVIGFIFCGKEFGLKTVYTSFLIPILIQVFERTFPNFTSLTGSDALDVVCYVFFVSIGLSILFNRNASSGGIDVIVKLMNKYLHIELGKAMIIAGMVVVMSGIFVFPPRTVLLSILGTYANGIVLDHFIFGQTLKKRVCIVSKNPDIVRNYIVHQLHSGATVYEAKGAYGLESREEVVAIVDNQEYRKLYTWITENDPDAFVSVYNVAEMRYQKKIINN